MFAGVLSELAGTGAKHYSGVTSLDDLMHRLYDDIPVLIHYNFHLTINGSVPAGMPVLRDGDIITLMPSFAGGCFLNQA